MAASGGHLQKFMDKLPQDVKTEFLKYGIEVAGGAFRVVNVNTGAIETGDAALQFMQAHPEVLAAFKVVGEGHRQEIIDAQWSQMKTASVKVPDTVLGWDWPKHAIQLVAHFHHAGDSYGWGKAQYYKDEGGPRPRRPLEGVDEAARRQARRRAASTRCPARRITSPNCGPGPGAPRSRASRTRPARSRRPRAQLGDEKAHLPQGPRGDGPAGRGELLHLASPHHRSGEAARRRRAGPGVLQLDQRTQHDRACWTHWRPARPTSSAGRAFATTQIMAGPETNEERIWFAMTVVGKPQGPEAPGGQRHQRRSRWFRRDRPPKPRSGWTAKTKKK